MHSATVGDHSGARGTVTSSRLITYGRLARQHSVVSGDPGPHVHHLFGRPALQLEPIFPLEGLQEFQFVKSMKFERSGKEDVELETMPSGRIECHARQM